MARKIFTIQSKPAWVEWFWLNFLTWKNAILHINRAKGTFDHPIKSRWYFLFSSSLSEFSGKKSTCSLPYGAKTKFMPCIGTMLLWFGRTLTQPVMNYSIHLQEEGLKPSWIGLLYNNLNCFSPWPQNTIWTAKRKAYVKRVFIVAIERIWFILPFLSFYAIH